MTRPHRANHDLLRTAQPERKLSVRDRDIFLKLIATDAKPNKALKAAAAKYKTRRV